MKKLLIFFISAIIALASCAKIDDITERIYTQDREITFTVGNSPATKAIVDSTVMVDNFGVYGYVVPGTYSENGGYLMRNAEYEETGDAANGAKYYWPQSDNNQGIDFIFTAYSQFVSNPIWENDTLKLSVPALNQALIDDPDGFNDILWAQTQYNHHQNSLAEPERVVLNFKHALSWLQFRGEVTNPKVKWAKVKQISFGEYRDSIPGVPAVDPIPAYDDTTDMWINLKPSSNIDGSPTKLRVKTGDTWGSFTNNAPLPDDLVAEIKSYYSVDGVTGTYNLGPLNGSNWDPTNNDTRCGKELRIVKAIPEEYKLTVERTDGTVITFFDALKYLKDNGYDIQPRDSGGKPTYWDNNYIVVDAYVNGTAYTLSFVNWSYSASVSVLDHAAGAYVTKPCVDYTIVHHDAVPGQPGVDPVPASGSEGLFVDGFLCLPTKDTLTTTPVATYGTQKDTTLNYVSAQVDTIFYDNHIVLGDALVIPQPVPQNITIVFDICIANETGEEVIFTDRKITRTINTGKDMVNVDYVPSWTASNKYIYNFNFDGSELNFSTSVSGWTLGNTNYHVWDY